VWRRSTRIVCGVKSERRETGTGAGPPGAGTEEERRVAAAAARSVRVLIRDLGTDRSGRRYPRGVVRAFVAVPVEDAVVTRRLAGARSLLPPLHGVRWVPEGQLHFTLKFLGEIGPDEVEAARRATSAASRAAPGPFRLALEGLGSFPPRGPARVVWAGCGEGAEELARLALAVEAAFSAEGFPREARTFSPHLTLARVKDPAAGRRLSQVLPSLPPEPFGTVRVAGLVLCRSELARRGPEYTDLLRTEIESAAAPQ
jgi:2'-5' RNA ligase